jgi:hypothetical protein
MAAIRPAMAPAVMGRLSVVVHRRVPVRVRPYRGCAAVAAGFWDRSEPLAGWPRGGPPADQDLAERYRRYNALCNAHDFAGLGESVAEDIGSTTSRPA